ncbi:TRAP transporter substrate-binding protein [Pararhizobium mangrovi]|uniref:TRAP transporter substrate-binding protein n=1 Tax=Pararhizobium mangrovi TaxID=2590452 RepID=A0A506TXB8_9HYPH|nr:TRAP transporter substrate-binding protein [Pararhizobium mangrovi]TPW26703.1 TRAP transporter substrate-binding protein [Pararhizobium mangrovi]
MRIGKRIAAFATVGLAMWATSALAEDLKFANYMAATHPYVGGTFEPFAKSVEQKTDGKLKVTLYNGGELGSGPAEQYSRVVDDVAELAVSLPGYTSSKFPLTLVTELPGVIDEDTGTKTIWNHIDLFQSEFRRVKLVSLWSSAENILYTRDEAVKSPDDIKGMKIRVPSRNTGKLVEAWGGTPVSMPVSEIYNAMQTGVIDGAMIDGTATRAFKLGEVAKYLTVGMETTISPFYIIMNRDAFENLTDDEKSAIESAGRKASELGHEVQVTEAKKGIEAFADMDGKTLIRLSDDQAAAFDKISEKVTKQVVQQQGDQAEKIVDALGSK